MNGRTSTDAPAADGAADGGGDIAAALGRVRADIARFAERHGRAPGSIELLAVGKTKPATALAKAARAGQRAFGENYVDEALAKIDALGHRTTDEAREPLSWHFIGTIQSRRCEAIAAHFDWAHGIDREKIARRLSERRATSLAPLDVCIQLNLDGEASKGGVGPEGLDALADLCAELPGLRLRGLMTIPAPRQGIDAQRRAFAAVRERMEALRARGHDGLDTLSMGMSGDLEAAIAEGATLVRVGTAVFGRRESKGGNGRAAGDGDGGTSRGAATGS